MVYKIQHTQSFFKKKNSNLVFLPASRILHNEWQKGFLVFDIIITGLFQRLQKDPCTLVFLLSNCIIDLAVSSLALCNS